MNDTSVNGTKGRFRLKTLETAMEMAVPCYYDFRILLATFLVYSFSTGI